MELKERPRLAKPESQRTVRLPGFVFTLGVHPAGSVLPRHSHDDPTICYVLRGRFTEHSRGDAADCESETLKVTPAGEPHWNRFREAETRGLRIDVDRARFADSPSIFRLLDERVYSKGGVAGALAKRLVYELSSNDDAGLIAAEGLALELLAELGRVGAPRAMRGRPHWLFVADELIHEAYATRSDIADIARTVGVHPATLARGYRNTFGCTVGERIRRLRVEHAARALLETTEPLSEVALGAGFYDQSHFTNVFRRYLGVTPGEYRARLG
jgi:AraC family transcriptional regulator